MRLFAAKSSLVSQHPPLRPVLGKAHELTDVVRINERRHYSGACNIFTANTVAQPTRGGNLRFDRLWPNSVEAHLASRRGRRGHELTNCFKNEAKLAIVFQLHFIELLGEIGV